MNLYDIKSFIATISIYKLYNALKVLASFYVSSLLKKSIQWGLPFTISIEPTTKCNLACPECPSGLKSFTRATGDMDSIFFSGFLLSYHKELLYLYFYFQGEPFMHNKLLDNVALAVKKNIYTVTSTNAHFITERKAEEIVKSGLHRIIISMDGIEQETYEKYRKKGTLEKVQKGIANIVAAKKKAKSKTPLVVLQCLIVSHNEHEIDAIKSFGKEVGVDKTVFKTAQIYNYKQGSSLMPKNSKYNRYKKNIDGTYSLKSTYKNKCWKLWHSCVITWNFNVVPCCFDKDAKYIMGNVGDNNLAEIWYNKSYNLFREKLIQNRKGIDICMNCSEGLKVWQN